MSISICLSLAYCFLFYHSSVVLDLKQNLYYLAAVDFEPIVLQLQAMEFRLVPLYFQILLEVSHLVLVIRRLLLRL